MPLSDVSVFPDDERPERTQGLPRRPHVAVSIYTTVTINNDTGIIESCYVTVTRHYSKSLCSPSCSLWPGGRTAGNISIFQLDPAKEVKVTRKELYALLHRDDSMIHLPLSDLQENYRKAKDKLIEDCHLQALEKTLSKIPPPIYSRTNSEQANGGCKSDLSQHYVALISAHTSRPDDDQQLGRDTLVAMRGRKWFISTPPSSHIDLSRTVVRIEDDYPKKLPYDWEYRKNDIPTTYTQRRPSVFDGSGLTLGSMGDFDRNDTFLQGLFEMCVRGR